VACAGAKPLAVTDCLNFGNPLKPEIFYQLAQAVRGISEACRALGTPVTGGNVSLYNENPDGAIWPTPVIGMIGKIVPPARIMKGHCSGPEMGVLVIGPESPHLGASEFLRWATGKPWGPCPPCDLAAEQRMIEFLQQLACQPYAASAHDCSIGGLVVSLAETILWAEDDILGAEISIQADSPAQAIAELFGEFAPRVVATVPIEATDDAVALARRYLLPARVLGRTNATGRLVLRAGDASLEFETRHLRDAYESFRSVLPESSDEMALH